VLIALLRNGITEQKKRKADKSATVGSAVSHTAESSDDDPPERRQARIIKSKLNQVMPLLFCASSIGKNAGKI